MQFITTSGTIDHQTNVFWTSTLRGMRGTFITEGMRAYKEQEEKLSHFEKDIHCGCAHDCCGCTHRVSVSIQRAFFGGFLVTRTKYFNY